MANPIEAEVVNEKALALPAENRGLALIEKMIEGGLTAENAAAFQTLCTTAKEMKADAAREAFFFAKAALQAEMPHVAATKAIVDDKGRTRARWAPYEEVMQTIQPFLVKHGFSVSFDCRIDAEGKRMTAICIVSHVRGHSERNEFSVHTSAPPGCSPAQGDGSTMTYAQRYALLAAFGIAVDKDNDARMEGATIDPETARELRDGLRDCGWTEVQKAGFWQTAGVKAGDFTAIREGKVTALRQALATIKPVGAAPQPTSAPPPSNSVQESPKAPAADQGQCDKAWGYIRAISKAGNADTEKCVKGLNKALGLAPSTTFAEWDTETTAQALLKLEAKAVKEGIDATPYLAGGPEFQSTM
jgi:hypothetical protein